MRLGRDGSLHEMCNYLKSGKLFNYLDVSLLLVIWLPLIFSRIWQHLLRRLTSILANSITYASYKSQEEEGTSYQARASR